MRVKLCVPRVCAGLRPDTLIEMCRSSGEKDLFARGEGEVQRWSEAVSLQFGVWFGVEQDLLG